MNQLLTAEAFQQERKRNQARRSRDRKNCRRKTPYPTEESAERAAMILAARNMKTYAWYRCPVADHWHCGSTNPPPTPKNP